MRFAFTDDQLAIRDAVREMLAAECPPTAVRAAWEGHGRTVGAWAGLAEMGVLGMLVPEAADGLGLSELDVVLVHQEAGRAALPDPLLHATLAAWMLGQAGDTHWLPRILDGSLTAAVGHCGRMPPADVYVMRLDDQVYAVPASAAHRREAESVDHTRRLGLVTFNPAEARVLDVDWDGAFDRGAVFAAAELVGLGRRALDMAVEYAKVREQFGKPIGTFQAVKHRLASALVDLAFAEPLVHRAAWCLATSDPAASVAVSMAKAKASDAAWAASKAALQVHGAIGYTTECDLHFWMKRIWALAQTWGDPRMHRERIAHHYLEDPHA